MTQCRLRREEHQRPAAFEGCREVREAAKETESEWVEMSEDD